ncbi:MAG: hypothetical protein HY541_00765 [Deltaproteobacteria bacterium]|nr:hypothetical protein [Deltaproteobacteria bacterium]
MLKRILLLVVLGLGLNIHSAQAFSFGFFAGDNARDNFYVSTARYFGVPRSEVVLIEHYGIPVEEIPVVLFISQRANVLPYSVSMLRLGGMPWIEVVRYYNLSPVILYTPVAYRVTGPPYGYAYGYYWKKAPKKWNRIVLRDNDVVNLVNLRFLSSYHRLSPEKVIEMRSSGRSFTAINRDAMGGKKGEKLETRESKIEKKTGITKREISNKKLKTDSQKGKEEKVNGKKEKGGKGHGKKGLLSQ